MQENTATPDTSDAPFQFHRPGDDTLFALLGVRTRLVEKAEEISIRLEDRMVPGVAASLTGDEQAKARHLYLTQARKIERELNKLLAMADNFKVHIY
jgi:hypothetical protein